MFLVFGEVRAADLRRLAWRAAVSRDPRVGATPTTNADGAGRAVPSCGGTRRRRIVGLLCIMVLTGSGTLALPSPHAAAWESKAGSTGPTRSAPSAGCLTEQDLLTSPISVEITAPQSDRSTP